MSKEEWEVIIIGGGPAGLSAALTLGRCRRRVLVCDAGQTRNRAAAHMHAFLTRDGASPADFMRIAREQLRAYETVTMREELVMEATRIGTNFEVMVHDGTRYRCRKLLLATGVVDHLPPLAGIESFYGRSVHHCPYCDAWEWRDQPIAVYGNASKGGGLALMLKQWSADVMLFTDGPGQIDRECNARLERERIPICEERVLRLEGTDAGQLQRIVLASGESIARSALFFNTGQHQRSALAARLGCDFTDQGGVAVRDLEVTTRIPGLYVAGDASRDVQFVIVAAAEGAKAAFAINKALLEEAERMA